MAKTKQLTSFVPLGQLLSRLPPQLCGNILREALKRSSLTVGAVSNNIKKAGRILYAGGGCSTEFQCQQCESLLDYYPETTSKNLFQLTAVTITFNRMCYSERQHIVGSLGAMQGLRRLGSFQVGSSCSFYDELARKSQFTLDYFGCDGHITGGLVRFLIRQPQLSECSILADSKSAYRLPAQYRATKVLSNVIILQTTAPLLTDQQFDLFSVRRLEYIGDSNQLTDQVAAIDRIYQLGPQLEALRFRWDTGKVETFLDVTKFAKLAKRTPALRYLQMINVNKNVFEDFVVAGLESKTWLNLETLVWVPTTPWTVAGTVDTLGSDGKSIVTLRRCHRVSTLSNGSSRFYADRDFRIQCIGRELMETFPSMRRFAIWNWTREGYDVMSRKPGICGGLSWTYRVTLDENEWMLA